MRAQITGAPEDRALDDRAAADVRARVDHGALDPGALAQRRVRPEDGAWADARLGRDAAVVPDEGGPLDLVEILEIDAQIEGPAFIGNNCRIAPEIGRAHV